MGNGTSAAGAGIVRRIGEWWTPVGRTSMRPTSHLAGFLLLMVMIWYAGASQSNAAAYLLGFFLVGVATVAELATWANLRALTLRVEGIRPGFAGDEFAVPFVIENASRRCCYAVRVVMRGRWGEAVASVDRVGGGGSCRGTLTIVVTERGEHRLELLSLETQYPFGLCRAVKRVAVEAQFLVYPRPAGHPELPYAASSDLPESPGEKREEGDDFAGVRSYRHGESQRHIDWKAVARGHPLVVKQFAGAGERRVELAWELTSDLGHEARLSQLALWVVKAERGEAFYGMKMPGVSVEAGRGDEHCHRCLKVLAVYPRVGEGRGRGGRA